MLESDTAEKNGVKQAPAGSRRTEDLLELDFVSSPSAPSPTPTAPSPSGGSPLPQGLFPPNSQAKPVTPTRDLTDPFNIGVANGTASGGSPVSSANPFGTLPPVGNPSLVHAPSPTNAFASATGGTGIFYRSWGNTRAFHTSCEI